MTSTTATIAGIGAAPSLTCALCKRAVYASCATQGAPCGTASAEQAPGAEAIVKHLLDAELWPVDGEIATEIRAMFLSNWGMDSTQADARMSRLNYAEAIAALPKPAPGAIGSSFGGGIYAGISRGVDGAPDQHLVLLFGQAEDVSWSDACDWAKSICGALPTRAEQALLFANLKDQFEPRWYWSSEQAGPSTAWDQYFDNGTQVSYLRSYEGRARAVRRLPI